MPPLGQLAGGISRQEVAQPAQLVGADEIHTRIQ